MSGGTLIPLVSEYHDINKRGEFPLVYEWLSDVQMGAMVAGVKVTTVKSKLGLSLGEPLGIIPFNTKGAGDNEVLAFSVALSSTDDSIDITMHSSDNTATDNLTISFLIIGRQLPSNA